MSIKSIDGQSISMICIDEKLELSLIHLYCPPLVTEQPLMVRGTSVYNGQPIVRILPLATFVLDISHAYCLLYTVTNSIMIAPFFYFYMCKSLFTTQVALCSILPNQMGELIATCNTDGILCTCATLLLFTIFLSLFNIFSLQYLFY